MNTAIIGIMPDNMVPISEAAINVCTHISEGKSIKGACKLSGISHVTFCKEMRINPALVNNYMRAREMRSDLRFEGVEKLKQELREGKIDANQFRVLLDAIKWQCAHEKPKVYGDSMTLKGDKENPLEIGLAGLLDAAMSKRLAIAERDRETIDLPVVDVTETDKS